jgi:putative transposase
MTSIEVWRILTGQGIEPSHSRPHVSNDNPFSEALFKTLKYDLDYPRQFEDHRQARSGSGVRGPLQR